VPSREDALARRELLKVNADLARLGGLQKLAISQGGGEESRRLAQEILSRQTELKKAIADLYKVTP
jgi:hypothetical protein